MEFVILVFFCIKETHNIAGDQFQKLHLQEELLFAIFKAKLRLVQSQCLGYNSFESFILVNFVP